MKSKTFLAFTLMLALLVGCEVPELDIPMTEAERQGKQQLEEDQKARAEAGIAEKAPAASSEAEVAPAEPKEFTATDPKKGKKSREAGGYLGAVGNARFTAEHKMVINQYKHALNLYWAEKGEYPKTHKEFMDKIIDFNQIKLPELDDGMEYIYDPTDHLLKIQPIGASSEDVQSATGEYIGDVAMGKFAATHKDNFDAVLAATEAFTKKEGRFPNSHKEFMEKIIDANQIKLPELEPGMNYFYDSENQLLKILRS